MAQYQSCPVYVFMEKASVFTVYERRLKIIKHILYKIPFKDNPYIKIYVQVKHQTKLHNLSIHGIILWI